MLFSEEDLPWSRWTIAIHRIHDPVARPIHSPCARTLHNTRCLSLQMTKAATEGDICRFVMRSYRSFEQALYQRVADEHRPTADNLEGDSDASADRASADPVGAELLSGSRPHFFASVMREGAGSCSSGMLDMITVETRKHSYEFRLVEHAADR